MAVYKKQLKVITFADALDEIVNIGNLDYLRNLSFEFAGTLTAAGGSSDGALQEDGLLRTVLNILTLTANGSDPFGLTDAIGEYYRRAIMSGSPGVLVSTMPTGAASTSQRFHVVVDFDQLQTAARFAGRIPARRLSSLDLRIQGGAVETNMVTGGDRTETMTGTLTIVALYDDSPRGYKGGGRRITKKRVALSAANDDYEVAIPSGLLVSDILLKVVDNSARDNALLTNLEVRIGDRDVRFKSTFLDTQSDNVEKFGLELSSGAPPYTGLALIHFDEDGDMSPSKLLNTVGLKVEGGKLIFKNGAPTGTAYVDVYVYAVDPAGVGR